MISPSARFFRTRPRYVSGASSFRVATVGSLSLSSSRFPRSSATTTTTTTSSRRDLLLHAPLLHHQPHHESSWGLRSLSTNPSASVVVASSCMTRCAPHPLLLWRHHNHYSNHQQQIRRFKSVFVSKHNQSLCVTAPDIMALVPPQHAQPHRVTATHVILASCPFCAKPATGANNQYKLYIQLGGGAYFCHRCGAGGSWFDFKARLSGKEQPDTGTTTTTTTNIGWSTARQQRTASPTTTTTASASAYARSSSTSSTSSSTSSKKLDSFLQQRPVAAQIPCLPMPSPRLQALYSSQLLDTTASTTTTNHNTNTSNTNNNHTVAQQALHYLTTQRGLTVATLRKYCVGLAHYSFPDHNSNSPQQPNNGGGGWVSAPCITFPWILKATDIAYQEQLRGAVFVYEPQEKQESNNNNNNNTTSDEPVVATASDETTTSATTSHDNTTTTTTTTAPKRGRRSKKPNEDNNDTNDTTETTPPTTAAEAAVVDTFLTRRIKARALEQKSWQRLDPPGGGWGLFGYHTIPAGCRQVVVTEGEYDAMAVAQATGLAAVSLPNGCRSLPVEVLPLLEDMERIYLWMDHDAPGQQGAELFAKKLGTNRCFLVRPTLENTGVASELELPKDANDALLMGLNLQAMIDDAKVVPHERISSFANLRAEVLHEIMYPETYVGCPVPSLPKFTHLIKGLRRGELTVLTGATGSGKTTLLGQLSLDLAEQEINVLWGSFEIRNTRLMHKLLQQFAREPLPVGDPAVAIKLNHIADRFENLPLHFMTFHGGSDVDDVLDAMDYAVYVNDVEHIILDNMQFMISRKENSKSTFDKFDVQDLAVEKFRKFATDRNVHVTLVVHPRKQDEDSKLSISSIYGSAKATQEADTVIILQHEGGKKYLDVRKNRFNGELGSAELFFDRQSCRYSEVPPFNTKPAAANSSSSNSKPVPAIAKPKVSDSWDKRFA